MKNASKLLFDFGKQFCCAEVGECSGQQVCLLGWPNKQLSLFQALLVQGHESIDLAVVFQVEHFWLEAERLVRPLQLSQAELNYQYPHLSHLQGQKAFCYRLATYDHQKNLWIFIASGLQTALLPVHGFAKTIAWQDAQTLFSFDNLANHIFSLENRDFSLGLLSFLIKQGCVQPSDELWNQIYMFALKAYAGDLSRVKYFFNQMEL